MSTPATPFYPATHDDAQDQVTALGLLAKDATMLQILAALQAMTPGLVTTAQRGFLAPDAEAIENGFIKLATSGNKGLMSKAFAELLEDPTKIIFFDNAATRSAAYHNAMPKRGKNLGSSITSAQLNAIANRTYDGLWLGDFWVINGHTHTIVSFEPYWNIGDTALQRGHIGIVTDGGWTSAWYSSNDTSHGYVSLETGTIRKYIRDTVQPAIQTDFGSSHVLTYRALYPTTYSNGAATGWAWADACVELLSEMEVYGGQVWESSPYEVGQSARQLDLFRIDPAFKYNRSTWWLRGVYSASGAAFVLRDGDADRWNASGVCGVRPLSLIG